MRLPILTLLSGFSSTKLMGYKDALVYQDNCKTLGYEPFSDEDMAEMKRGHDALSALRPSFREAVWLGKRY